MADDNDTAAVEDCQITFWRGYVKCAFYAVPTDGEPIGSPFFRSRDGSPIQSGGALEAHRELIEKLEDEGWEPVARGPAWYELTFTRRSWSPLAESPVEKPLAVEAHASPSQAPSERAPEPVPVPQPSVVPAAAHRSRRQLALLLVAAALIALAVGLGLTLFGTNSAQGNDRTNAPKSQPHPQPRTQHRRSAASVVPAAREQSKAAPTTIVVTASRGDSWVEAKVGSARGESLFAGVVSVGQTVRVTAPVVWITFGAAGNLDVRVNGRSPVPGTFDGTVTAVIAHGRVRPA